MIVLEHPAPIEQRTYREKQAKDKEPQMDPPHAEKPSTVEPHAEECPLLSIDPVPSIDLTKEEPPLADSPAILGTVTAPGADPLVIHYAPESKTPQAPFTNSSGVAVDSPVEDPDVAETEAMFNKTQPSAPHTAEQVKAGVKKAVETYVATGGNAGVADPTQEVDPWFVVLDEFYLRFKPGLQDASSVQGKKRKHQIARLRTLTQETLADKGLSTEEMIARAVTVLRPLAITEKWWIKTTTTPFQDGWAEGFTTMLIVNPTVVEAQARDAQRNGGSSGPRQDRERVVQGTVVVGGGQ